MRVVCVCVSDILHCYLGRSIERENTPHVNKSRNTHYVCGSLQVHSEVYNVSDPFFQPENSLTLWSSCIKWRYQKVRSEGRKYKKSLVGER